VLRHLLAAGRASVLGVAYTEQATLHDGDGSSETFEVGSAGQIADRLGDGGGGLVGQAQDDDPGMGSWRVGADVPQPAVERDQDPPGGSCRPDYVGDPALR